MEQRLLPCAAEATTRPLLSALTECRRPQRHTPQAATRTPPGGPAGREGVFSLYNWHLKPLWQMEENYVIKADILLYSLGLLILLSFTGRSVGNGNQPVAACSSCREDTSS